MYIVVELQTNNAGVVSNIVTSFDTLAEAESKYYTILAAAAISTIPVHSAIIVSEEGFPAKHQCYKHEPYAL
jgi:hypothetical protein